jgi:hypothetical protein
MNITTLETKIDPFEVAKLAKALEDRNPLGFTEFDKRVNTLNKAFEEGYQLVDCRQAVLEAGLDKSGLPKIAWAKALANKVCVFDNENGIRFQDREPRVLGMSDHSSWHFQLDGVGIDPTRKAKKGSLIQGDKRYWSTPVPTIPPTARPDGKEGELRDKWILFETEGWTSEIARDPILVKPLVGSVGAILSQWDLTETERAIMGLTVNT